MVKWAVELSEFDIKYEPRGSIKGQVFADFVVELSSEVEQNAEDDFRRTSWAAGLGSFWKGPTEC